MSVGRRFVTIGVCAALFTGAFALPVSADQALRSGDPDIIALQQTPEDVLRASVKSARVQYTTEITAARLQRDTGLVAPRAERAAALKLAKTKAERRLARRAYDRSAEPVLREYRTVKQALQAKRNAVIDEALAVYLEQTGKPAIAVALKAYRDATTIAGDTLELALKSGRDTLKTDTADERAQLVADLEDTTTEAAAPRRVAGLPGRVRQGSPRLRALDRQCPGHVRLGDVRGSSRVQAGHRPVDQEAAQAPVQDLSPATNFAIRRSETGIVVRMCWANRLTRYSSIIRRAARAVSPLAIGSATGHCGTC